MLKRFLSKAIVIVIATVIITGIALLLLRAYGQKQVDKNARIESANGIESLEELTINGDKQWIYIRGHDLSNPVLLFLHGGPGMSEMPIARHMGSELERAATIVHWDQRGSGKSRNGAAQPRELSVQAYLDDVLDLTQQLRQRFGKEKIYLVGHSWGSLLGILTVRDHPNLYHAYVGIGQIANMRDNERVSLAFVQAQALQRNNLQAQEQLAAIDIERYAHDLSPMQVQRRWLYTFGGGVRLSAMWDLVKAYWSSPEYTLSDLQNLLTGGEALPARLWSEVMAYDLTEQAVEFELPIYFFAGENDYNTPSELAAAYHELLAAPHKELVWFDGAAHFPNFSSADVYQRVMQEKVLIWHD